MAATYTEKDILNDLDSNGNYEYFLDLEHGYFHTSGSRINLFADEKRWAIVFEKSGFGNRSGMAQIIIDYMGNCITNRPELRLTPEFITSTIYIDLIGDEFTRIEEDFELISKSSERSANN